MQTGPTAHMPLRHHPLPGPPEDVPGRGGAPQLSFLGPLGAADAAAGAPIMSPSSSQVEPPWGIRPRHRSRPATQHEWVQKQ